MLSDTSDRNYGRREAIWERGKILNREKLMRGKKVNRTTPRSPWEQTLLSFLASKFPLCLTAYSQENIPKLEAVHRKEISWRTPGALQRA